MSTMNSFQLSPTPTSAPSAPLMGRPQIGMAPPSQAAMPALPSVPGGIASPGGIVPNAGAPPAAPAMGMMRNQIAAQMGGGHPAMSMRPMGPMAGRMGRPY